MRFVTPVAISMGTFFETFPTLATALSEARDGGVLTRIRGTPLPAWAYLAGQIAAAVLFTLASLTITLSLAACGFLLAALVPNSKAVAAVGLAVLFVLAFFSDVFLVGGPEWMGNVGALLPLKHLQNGLADAWGPSGPVLAWENLAVLVAWSVVAGAVSVRLFRWDPRRS